MPDHLSVSQIQMFQRCPMQYEFSYIKGIKRPPAGVMILGSAYHKAIASELEYKKNSGNLLKDSDISDIFSESFEREVNQKKTTEDGESTEFEEIDWGEEDPGKMKDMGISLALIYHNEWVPNINPLMVELYQETEIAGVKFVLVTDVVTENKIIDHKVSKRRFSEDDLARDIQVTAYTYVHSKQFEFHQALKQKILKIEAVPVSRDEKDWKFFEMMVDKTNKAIQAGNFYPNTNGWHCSEDYCGYWNICKGR